ncbi:MAG: hypothetical protein N3E46_13535, partial [Gemmataceae bacterium]|nr:hypothetical protein [Gemmataceae bacterium]
MPARDKHLLAPCPLQCWQQAGVSALHRLWAFPRFLLRSRRPDPRGGGKRLPPLLPDPAATAMNLLDWPFPPDSDSGLTPLAPAWRDPQ